MTARAGLVVALMVVLVAPALADLPRRVRDPDDIWKPLARDPETEVAEREYERAMLEGDNNLDFAVAESQVASRRKKYVENAVRAYELAARALPTAPEPHFRAAAALHAFYLECNQAEGAALCNGGPMLNSAERHQAERVIAHWDAFEKLAPRDPRLVDEIMFERAILHTKLATPEHLDLARKDYRAIMARKSLRRGRSDSLPPGNLAETEMMLGNLDEAIPLYELTLQLDQSISYYFGLAVALDRDEQLQRSRAILRTFGLEGVKQLEKMIADNDVFYVPEGEAFYYLALGYEAIGYYDEAIRFYDLFLSSGAHPQFAPRARSNRSALVGHRSRSTADHRRR